MKEGSLVAFTLLSQTSIGGLWIQLGYMTSVDAGLEHGPVWTFLVLLSLMGVGLIFSFFHLGSPFRAWRALGNLKSSWLSREILFAALYMAGMLGLSAITGLRGMGDYSDGGKGGWLVWSMMWLCVVLGLGLLTSMIMAYRLRTVPAWRGWMTGVSFFVTTVLLGGSTVGLMQVWIGQGTMNTERPAMWIAWILVLLAVVQLIATVYWVVRLSSGPQAARTAWYCVTQKQDIVYTLRLVLLIVGILFLVQVCTGWLGEWNRVVWTAAFAALSISEVLGRMLFYQASVRSGV